MDRADWVHEMTILYGERHAHNFRRAASALDRVAALERELAEARKDGARLEYIANKGSATRYQITIPITVHAYAALPMLYWTVDDIRAAIDAAMGGE